MSKKFNQTEMAVRYMAEKDYETFMNRIVLIMQRDSENYNALLNGVPIGVEIINDQFIIDEIKRNCSEKYKFTGNYRIEDTVISINKVEYKVKYTREDADGEEEERKIYISRYYETIKEDVKIETL